MQKAKEPGIAYRPFGLDGRFPVHFNLNGRRDDRPIDSFQVHDVLEIGMCTAGAGTLFVKGRPLPVQQGDITVITPLEWHRFQSARGTVSSWCWFFCDPVRLLVPGMTRDLPYAPEMYAGDDFVNVLAGGSWPEITSVLMELVAEGRSRGPGYEDAMRALILVFLHRLHRRSVGARRPAGHAGTAAPERLLAALDLIARRYMDPLRIGDLAESCNMSLRSFQLHFRRLMGQSAQAYLIQCRVQAAVALLRATDRPVSEIALSCGFRSLSTFNRAFRAHLDKAPRDFRH